ncbi:MAG: nucleotidyltransferase family protein [Planctomycetales bacterium]
MQAFVLAAGYGTRLGSATAETPKPMLDVEGRPLLEYVLRNLGRCGFRNVSLNLHFMPESITDHFGDGAELGMTLRYTHEAKLLGTAGGVRGMTRDARPTETFLVHYGDVLTDHDFRPMLDFHRQSGALVTMLIHQRPNSNSTVVFDDNGRVTRFLERPTEAERVGLTSCWANSGIALMEPGVLDLIPTSDPTDFPRDVFPLILARRRLFAFPLSGYRCAIDSLDRLRQAQAAAREGRVLLS